MANLNLNCNINGASFRRYIIGLVSSKFALWTTPENERETYFVDKVGTQERELLTQSGVAGLIHPGRAIQYTGSKSQYSTTAVTPANYRLVNNSVSFCYKIKLGVDLPSTNIPVFGNDTGTGSGRYYTIINDAGRIILAVRDNTSTKTITSAVINDDLWHDVFVVMDKVGYMGLYLDNVQQLSLIDISGSTFGDIDEGFRMGYSAVSTHVFQIRDPQIFPFAITSRTDRETLMNGGYVAGACGRWFCEEDKADAVYKIKDSIGTLHFTNFAFDSTSLVEGTWLSMLNKYGYANSKDGSDLLTGAGAFANPALWTITATRYTIENGILTWLAAGDTTPYCTLTAAISLATTSYYKWTFTVLSGTARLRLVNQAATQILAVADYAEGTHEIIFKPAAASTKFVMQSYQAGGAYTLSNVSIATYEAAYISPVLSSETPTLDTTGRSLVFAGQAKYNLIKVDANTVKFPSYIVELFDACELINVNNWYDANGVGQEIDLVNIAPYQAKRQYYGRGTLIIIKADQVVSDYEDLVIRMSLGIGNPTKIYYPIPVSLGTLTGTTAEIYATERAMLDETTYTQDVAFTPLKQELNPEDDYLSIEWADFFQTDVNSIIPLAAKYGFANTFYRQIKPASDDPLTTLYYDRSEIPHIEQSGQREANHGFGHIGQLGSLPLADGLINPTNNDFRVERNNGTNALGRPVLETVDASFGEAFRRDWLLLSDTIGATVWTDLTDANCQTIRESYSLFTLPLDGQGHQLVLETLDILSERYCGTTGKSVYNNDYSSIRVPNTIDGNPVSESNRIVGGIFQGAATTQNQEIWERVFIIDEAYKREFEYLNIKQVSYGTPAGAANAMFFHNNVAPIDLSYQDKEMTKLATGTSNHISSITGENRSWFQCMRNNGYQTATVALGQGYSENNYDVQNFADRYEAQRIHKKNGCKKLDEIGDGYVNAMRSWDASIPEADQEALLTAEDLIKDLYDYTFTNERYAGMGATGSTPPYHAIINTLCKYNAWGITPDCGADSSTGTVAGRASMVMVMEALYQFCKRSGVKVISFEEAVELGKKAFPANHNYFPNSTFKTSPKTITASLNAPAYPDGWNGGTLTDGELAFTVGTWFNRQYAIKSGDAAFSIQTKGVGTLLIKKIINDDTYNNTDGSAYTVIKTIAINSVDYAEKTETFTIPALTVEEYTTPTTPTEEAYQEYMRGYGKNWCGLQFEIVVTGENTVTIKLPELLIN